MCVGARDPDNLPTTKMPVPTRQYQNTSVSCQRFLTSGALSREAASRTLQSPFSGLAAPEEPESRSEATVIGLADTTLRG